MTVKMQIPAVINEIFSHVLLGNKAVGGLVDWSSYSLTTSVWTALSVSDKAHLRSKVGLKLWSWV